LEECIVEHSCEEQVIDLHSHVLPEIDDGAESLAQTEAMLDSWRTHGFTDVAATPHLNGPLSREYQERVDATRVGLVSIAAARGITLHRGFEIMLTPDVPRRLASGEPITLDGQCAVLVEVPFNQWPLHTESTLFSLQTAGYLPILAHPERYTEVQRRPELAVQLAERGVILQVTYGSLAGIFGREVRRTAEAIVEANAAGIMATDAHNPGRRLASVDDGLARLTSLVGPDRAMQLTVDAPRALLQGHAPPAPLPLVPERRGFGWFRR
jgi:protein-tyrosine phosphatase